MSSLLQMARLIATSHDIDADQKVGCVISQPRADMNNIRKVLKDDFEALVREVECSRARVGRLESVLTAHGLTDDVDG